MPRSRFLPLLTVWFLAVLVLASLLYWNGGTEKPPPKPSANKATSTGQSSIPKPRMADPPAKQPEAGPVAGSRTPSPKGGEPSGKETGTREPARTTAPAGKPLIEPPPPFHSRDIPIDQPKEPARKPDSITLSALRPGVPPGTAPLPPSPVPAPVAKVAIVIDDFGQNLEVAKKFLSIPLPLSFAILPNQRHTAEIAELAHAHHREVLLHLPMEPQGYPKMDPGSGALLTSMSRGRLRRTLLAALDSTPYFIGVNNHMGSKFTENTPSMRVVMSELRHRKLFFLDSATTGDSVGFALAREYGIPARKRDIFLDHTLTDEAVQSQVDQLIRKAKIEGTALAIGHPHEVTLKALIEEVDRFKEENVAVVPSSELMIVPSRRVGGRD